MHPYPRPGPPPNYALRRLVAASGLVVVFLILWTLVARVVGGNGDDSAATTTTVVPSPTTVPLVAPPACAFPEQSEPTIFAREQDWYRTLVDPIYAVPELYEPPDLASASTANYAAEFRIRSLMAEDLNRLRNAILSEGLPEVAILAAYRSVADQRTLYERRVGEMGVDQANRGTARPGHSEHHLGTTVDFRLIGESSVDAGFGETPTGMWLADNAWRFGFVLSYPRGVEEITCYKYEPWHFRYIGPDLAGRIRTSGLTLREYLWHWEVTGAEPGVSPSAVDQLPLPTTTVAAEGSG